MANIEISWGIEKPEWSGKFERIRGNHNRCSRVETIVVNASEIGGGKLGFSGIAFACKCILPIDESRVNIAPVNYSRFMNLTSSIFFSVYRIRLSFYINRPDDEEISRFDFRIHWWNPLDFSMRHRKDRINFRLNLLEDNLKYVKLCKFSKIRKCKM